VPFIFDVHTMIYSDDAPNIERTIHKPFDTKSVNLVNSRKEFFNVSLDDIETVVKKNLQRSRIYLNDRGKSV